jgi:hydrophobic/amphiphilic exporter-1 (mainly G- bacteria), HAE1 family
MKKITQFSVNYPVTVLMIVMGVLLLGYISFSKLGIDLFPKLNSPQLYIELDAGDRPPEEVENLFVKNIEAQAIRQSDVVEVSSVTRVGTATITVEYSWGKDMDEAYLDLQKAMNSYTQNADIEELTISQYDPNATPIMVVSIENENFTNLDEVRKVAENYVRNELIRIEGIADVKLSGEEVAEVHIQTDEYLLKAYGITAENLASKIESYNRNVSGGTIEENGTNYSIKGVGMISVPDDLNSLIIGFATEEALDGTTTQVPVYLHDVAEITLGKKDVESIVTLDGRRSIGLSIYKEPSYNTVKAIEELSKALVTIGKALPGYSFTVVRDQGGFISGAIKEVRSSALIGILLAVAVLFVFLRRIKTTLVISIAIPISIIATFTLMYFQGLTLNVMTLGGLALGAGMLVDNSIIVMENIYRQLEQGRKVRDAAIEGTAEVGGAIVASTLTTIVVFLPIVYLQGASGELFKDQAWTVAFSLLSSLVVAILVIPVLVTKIFGKTHRVKPAETMKFTGYSRFLDKVLNRRWVVIPIAALGMGLSVLLIPHIGSEFMPRTSSKNFSIEMNLPEGTMIESTASLLQQVESMARETMPQYIDRLYSTAGETASASGSSVGGENKGTLAVNLTDEGAQNYDKVIEVFNAILSANNELVYQFKQDEASLQTLMGNDEPPLVIEVMGEDLDVIAQVTEAAKTEIQGIEGLYNIETSIENGAPELNIRIDRMQAGILNIGVEQIISQVKNKLQAVSAGQYTESGEMRDISVRMPKVRIDELASMEITSGSASYRLSDLAVITEEVLPREIHRRNQTRTGKVSAYVNADVPFDNVVQTLQTSLNNVPRPDGYRIQIAGEEVKRKESMSGLTFALILSIVLVYMVMAAQFESLLHPFTILLTIPLALVGTVVTFFLVGQTFNMMAFIGIIMLVGIAVNNSIILVDRINQLRAGGAELRPAILQAGAQRFRPIIMTSLTTILALIPLTFGFGESANLRSPMAWAVVGGLITSTILSLIVIPCVYYVFDFSKKKINNSNQ